MKEGNSENSINDAWTTSFSASEDDMQTFCKQMLKTRLFRGNFQEKRYVDTLMLYRDVIIVNGMEFTNDLLAVRDRLTRFYRNTVWTGISSNETNGMPCIWTDLKEHIPFGEYWFLVKSIQFSKEEICLKLKVLREFQPSDTVPNNSHRNNYINTETHEIFPERIAEDFVEYCKTFKNDFYKSLLQFFSIYVTADNTIYAVQYMFVLLGAMFTGTLVSIKYLGYFLLEFMDKMSVLITALTPIILRLIDLLARIIGGFFILLSMIWRDFFGRQRPQQRTIQYYPQGRRPLY